MPAEPAQGSVAVIGQDTVAVIGAGVIGCAVAWRLAVAGHRVLLLDRSEPGTGGASFGNVGHIATEQVEPLPSRQLLLGFWRELFALDGALDIPARRIMPLLPWFARFARAAFRQSANTRHLAPLVRSAPDALETLLSEIGRSDLMKRHGHYAVWLGSGASQRAAAEAANAARLEVPTSAMPAELLAAIATSVPLRSLPRAGLWYPGTAHVLGPGELVTAIASAAFQRGVTFRKEAVRHMAPRGERIEITTDTGSVVVESAVICAGAWSPPLLAAFGLHAPLEAERGYHVEMPGHEPLVDAPIVYADRKVVVTPMRARLRGSSYLELAGLDAPPDPRKPARLRAKLRELGYDCPPDGPSWMGPRPTLPDYLPGIGRAPAHPRLLYAVGHQHLGLTLSAVTADLIADLVAGRPPRFDTTAFDLRRFGTPRMPESLQPTNITTPAGM
jgi:D-amino-acid dehydrogenase